MGRTKAKANSRHDDFWTRGGLATSQNDRMTALENELDQVVDLVEGFGERLQ